MVLAVAAVFGGVGSIDVTGGAALGADHLLAQVIHGHRGTLLDDDNLDAGGVAGGEVHDQFTLVGDGNAGHNDVALTFLDSQQRGVEIHVVNDQFQAKLVGDGLGNLHVDALEAAVIGGHFIGRESGVGGHDQLAGLDGHTVGGVTAAGQQAHGHNQNQQHSNIFFHIHYSLLN